MISHLLNIVYGIVFGVANIIPGVSGGTMMVVFGVYDKVVDVLTLKLSAIKKNIRFIVFFGIGAVIGILGFSFVITWLFDNFPVATNMFFMGLIIGSIPLIYRNMTVGGRKITPKCLFAFIPALALVVGMTFINKLPQNESFTVNAVHNATDCTVTIKNNGSYDIKSNWRQGRRRAYRLCCKEILSRYYRPHRNGKQRYRKGWKHYAYSPRKH